MSQVITAGKRQVKKKKKKKLCSELFSNKIFEVILITFVTFECVQTIHTKLNVVTHWDMKCFVVYRRCKKVVKPFFDSPRFFSSCFAEPFLSGQRYTTTQPVWTLFLLKSTWTRPRGFQGCQKIRLLIKLLKLPPKGTNFEKSTKLKKKGVKTPCF